MRVLIVGILAALAIAAAAVRVDEDKAEYEVEFWSLGRFSEYMSNLPADQIHLDANITNAAVAPDASFAAWSRCDLLFVAPRSPFSPQLRIFSFIPCNYNRYAFLLH